MKIAVLGTGIVGQTIGSKLVELGHLVRMGSRSANTFGWHKDEIIDLGDIKGSRGTEMILPVWLRIYQTTGSGAFNLKIVR